MSSGWTVHQHAERKVEDVDALLLLQRARVEVEFQQPLLQTLGRETRLKAGVGVPAEDAALVGHVVVGLGEVGDLVRVGLLRAFGTVGLRRRGGGLAGDEGEDLALADEQPENLGAPLVHDLD